MNNVTDLQHELERLKFARRQYVNLGCTDYASKLQREIEFLERRLAKR